LPRPVAHCPKRRAAWQIDALVAPYSYSWPLDRQVQALKFDGKRALGRALGLLLTAEVRRRREAADALIPVPLHPARLRERGYNQAAEIARTVAAELGIPLHVHGIRRRKATASQSTLRLAERRANVAGAFAVQRTYAGLRVALVDDVITTGATVNALAAAVRSAGAASVVAWAIARTLEQEKQSAGDARAARSAAVEVVEQNAAEHGRADPGVVRECTKAFLGRAVLDENLLIDAQRRSGAEAAVVPGAELGASADEREARKQ
jgi:ComF family protein